MPRAYTKSGSVEKYESTQWIGKYNGNIPSTATVTVSTPNSNGEYNVTISESSYTWAESSDKSAGYYVHTKYGDATAMIYFSRTKNQSPYARVTFTGEYRSGMGFTVIAKLTSYGLNDYVSASIVCTLYGDGSMITNSASFSFVLSPNNSQSQSYATTGVYYSTWEIKAQPTKVNWSPKSFKYDGETINITCATSVALPR